MLKRILITTVGTLMLLSALGLGFVVAAPSTASTQATGQNTSSTDWTLLDEPDEEIGVDWFAFAAETLKLDEDAFWDALDAGQTLAQLAETQGIAPQALIDALVAAENAFIDQLVADGDITAEEAAESKSILADEVDTFVNEEMVMFLEGVDWFAVAAETLNLDEDAFWAALDVGQTLTQVAEAQGIAPQTLRDALVAAETASIDQLVADGDITAEQAAEWKATIVDDVEAFVNEDMLMEMEEIGVDWFAVAAETLKLDEEAFWAALDAGQTLAQVAEAQGIAPQTLSDALVAAETASIDQLVADGDITAEEAAEWKATIADDVEAFVNESWVFEWAEVEVETSK